MKVTSADIQFLIGCTRREAERIIIDAIGRNNIDKKFKVKSSTEIEVSNIKKRLLSVNESMDGKNPVQNAIDLLQQHGLSYSLKHQIFEDMNEKEYLQQELNEWYNIQSTLLNFLSRCSDETTAFVRGSLEEIAESLETE